MESLEEQLAQLQLEKEERDKEIARIQAENARIQAEKDKENARFSNVLN